MIAKFVLDIESGTFGQGQTQVNGNNIIKLDDFREHQNGSFDAEEINTYSTFFGETIYSKTITLTGTQLFSGTHPTGYNSSINHGIDISEYIEAKVKLVNPDPGSVFGGPWHSVEAVFGALEIGYLENHLAFKIQQSDGIIDPNKTYRFNLKYTKNGGSGEF